MVKLYRIVTAVVALLSLSGIPCIAQSVDDNVIYVVSDPHVMDPSLVVSKGTAFTECLAKDMKMLEQSVEALEAVVDSAILHHADVLLICGDLTKDGEKVSHQRVASILERALQAGVKPFVIPGNHDILNPNARYYDGATTRAAEEVTPDEFAQIYYNYGYGEGSVRDALSLSYSCDIADGLRLIAIDTSRYDENTHVSQGYAKNEAIVAGAVRDQTLQWAISEADYARAAGKQVLVMLHHQLLPHVDDPLGLLSMASVPNGIEIARQLAEHGIHVAFTGHMHYSDAASLSSSDVSHQLVDISTGSIVTYPAHYRVVTMNGTDLTVETRSLTRLLSVSNYLSLGRETMEASVEPLVYELTMQKWETLNSLMQAYAGGIDLGIASVSFNFPQTPEAMADMMYRNLGDFVKHAWQIVSEGNENDHEDYWDTYDGLYNELTGGVFQLLEETMVVGGLADIFKGAIKGQVMSKLAVKLDPVMESIFYDLTAVGTAEEDRTDDLTLRIDLQTGEKLRVEPEPEPEPEPDPEPQPEPDPEPQPQPEPQRQYESLLNEDKVWTMAYQSVYQPDNYAVTESRLAGDTIIGDVTFKRQLTRTIGNAGETPQSWKPTGAFLGQKDGKHFYFGPYFSDGIMTLMDFDVKSGQTITYTTFDMPHPLAVIFVSDTILASSTDRTLRSCVYVRNGNEDYYIDDIWVEGVGSLHYGIEPFLLEPIVGARPMLLQVTEGGTVLYQHPDAEVIMSVSSPTVDGRATDASVYDLQGRRLWTKPQRGFYILNRRKFVVK